MWASVWDIAAYQTGPTAQLDFPEIAYHFLVEGDGEVYYVQSLDKRVWHNGAPGRNERAIGICYTGDFAPNAKQKEGIKNAITWSQEQLSRSLSVLGHKDTYATACPGPAWPGWKPEILP